MLLSLEACSNKQTLPEHGVIERPQQSETEALESTVQASNILIAYFTVPETDGVDAAVIEDGLSVSRNSVAGAQADVKSWTDALLAD